MYQFAYHRPASLAEAEKLFSAADDPKFLGGGQTLIPTLKQRLASPSDLIDLGGLKDLAGISVSGGVVTIGAATRRAGSAIRRCAIAAPSAARSPMPIRRPITPPPSSR
jgi:carbon-monoxide dehydrogenase medium subunit